MATHNPNGVEPTDEHSRCLIKPMTEGEDGKPLFKPVHVMDALIVGCVVFFSLLLGASLPAVFFGEGQYLTAAEISSRLTTAAIGFFLTFFAQWARYRGVQIIQRANGDK